MVFTEPGYITVSAIVPCFNVKDTLEEAVRSLISQTQPPDEVILINDGSTDETGALLDRLQAAHPALIRVVHTENRGAPAARNIGLRMAMGEYIQYLDADDILHPDKLERQRALIQSEEVPPDLVVAPYLRRRPGTPDRTVSPEEGFDPWVALAQSRLGITGSNLWRKGCIERVGSWDETRKSSQEAELMFRMLKAGARLMYDPIPALILRKREASISTANRAEFLQRSLDLRVQMRTYFEERGDAARIERINQVIFDILDGLYKQDRRSSITLHHKVLSRSFQPPRARRYRWIYKVFGFRIAQWWRYVRS